VTVTVKTFDRLTDAAAALSAERGARFLAGGTLVMRAVNEADPTITTLVRSTDPSFLRVAVSAGRIELGAGVTMAAILADRELAFLHPVARAIGGPAVREAATVGGNLFAPSPYGDFAAALLALDASVTLADGYGQRELPLEELLGRRERGVSLVASVAFRRPATEAFRFAKVSRVHPKGVSVLSIAAQLPIASGRVSGARIAYGAMSRTPVRAKAAERALEGHALDTAAIGPALAVAADGTSPADDAIASAWWRREILPVHLRRLLLGAGQARADEDADPVPSQRRGGRCIRRWRCKLARPAARSDRRPIGQGRMLAGDLRHLHRADRWRPAAGLRHAGGKLRGEIDRDRRGAASRGRSSPTADRVHGALRGAVRLLHAGHADGRQSAPRPQPEPDAGKCG